MPACIIGIPTQFTINTMENMLRLSHAGSAAAAEVHPHQPDNGYFARCIGFRGEN